MTTSGERPATGAEALDALEDVVEFAYDHGYHEHGYPLVASVRAALAQERERLRQYEPDGVELTPSREWLLKELAEERARTARLRELLGEACWAMYGMSTKDWLECTECGATAPFGSTERQHRPDCAIGITLSGRPTP
jgi:hypothetical protein